VAAQPFYKMTKRGTRGGGAISFCRMTDVGSRGGRWLTAQLRGARAGGGSGERGCMAQSRVWAGLVGSVSWLDRWF
jgi:hypothetical protein